MRRTSVVVLAGALLMGGSLAVLDAVPTYAATPPGCSTTSATCTATFAYTGAEQTYVVPAGVTSVQVTAVGAAGGIGNSNAAVGRGASVFGSVAVTAGSTLYVEVGQRPDSSTTMPGASPPPAFNGGGAPGFGRFAGGGGGASDVRTVPRAQAASLESRLVVAGGGGGAAEEFRTASPGGDAGSPGVPTSANGVNGPDGVGGGAGSAPGGAGGAGGSGPFSPGGPGLDGGLGQGGAGGQGTPSGGGGGGGLYGGGGGGGGGDDGTDSHLAGGGGGSSLVPNGGTLTLTSAAASVTISYDRTVVAPTIPATLSTTYGTPVQVTATLQGTSTPDGATFAFTLGGSTYPSCAAVPAEATPQAGDNALQAQCTFSGQEPGSYSVQASFSGNTTFAPSSSNTATLTVDKVPQSVTFSSAAPSGPWSAAPTPRPRLPRWVAR